MKVLLIGGTGAISLAVRFSPLKAM